jgi:hypothetical protein
VETYALTILSIFVSVGLFLIGYRQTVGARKERIRSANSDLEKILLKRVVLESYQPNTEDLSHLINGKAHEHRVKSTDLLSEVQLLESVFARIAESDFITADQRNEIIKRLNPILVKAEESPLEERIPLEGSPLKGRQYYRMYMPWLMAVFASFIGVLVVLIPEVARGSKFSTVYILGGFAVSLGMSVFIILAYRFRESTEEVSGTSVVQSAINYEKEVEGALKKIGPQKKYARSGRGFDFMLEIGGRKILVEAKSWSHRVTKYMITRTIDLLETAIDTNGASEGIIVTQRPIDPSPYLSKKNRIRVMSLSEFRNYLTHENR